MSHAMMPLGFALFAVFAVSLMYLSARRQRRFYRDYQLDGPFLGDSYDCKVGGLDAEYKTFCRVAADPVRLYILPYPKRRGWSTDPVFNRSLAIPWADIEYKLGWVPVQRCIWFKMNARRVYLYVPKETGIRLLRDAGLPIPER
jgi:hypothetical protein